MRRRLVPEIRSASGDLLHHLIDMANRAAFSLVKEMFSKHIVDAKGLRGTLSYFRYNV